MSLPLYFSNGFAVISIARIISIENDIQSCLLQRFHHIIAEILWNPKPFPALRPIEMDKSLTPVCIVISRRIKRT
jgi:hypothetical protein